LVRLMKGKDNRKYKRISIQARATIGTNGLFDDGLLIDFSNKGLGLLLDYNKSFDVGQKLNISLGISPKPTTAQGVIKWIRKLKEGKLFGCAVGIELANFNIVRYGNLMKHAES